MLRERHSVRCCVCFHALSSDPFRSDFMICHLYCNFVQWKKIEMTKCFEVRIIYSHICQRDLEEISYRETVACAVESPRTLISLVGFLDERHYDLMVWRGVLISRLRMLKIERTETDFLSGKWLIYIFRPVFNGFETFRSFLPNLNCMYFYYWNQSRCSIYWFLIFHSLDQTTLSDLSLNTCTGNFKCILKFTYCNLCFK